MSTSQGCQEVVLVHGTFAADKQPKGRRWWQETSFLWGWLNESLKGQAACLKPFQWTGRNRERDRHEAGEALLARLLENEKQKRSYHLVGHSHGGSVIWHALRTAARRKQPLDGLKSWTTVGTPFFSYRLRRGDILFVLPLALALWTAPRVAAQAVITAESAGAMWGDGYHWWFLNLVALWALWLVAAYLCAFRVGALAVGAFTLWRERRSAEEAYRLYGPRWKGIWSPEDEAILGLQSTVLVSLRDLTDGEGRPLRIIPPSKWLLFLPGASKLGDNLVFEWLRQFLQGNDRVGLKVAAVSSSPLPGVAAEPLPEEVHRKLVRRVTEGIDFFETFERLRRLLGSIAFGGPFISPLKGEPGKPSIFNSILVHTLYLPEASGGEDQGAAPLIADQVAKHIARCAGEPTPAPYPKAPHRWRADVPRRGSGPLLRRFHATTAVQRAWAYSLLAVIFLTPMAADALFERVREYTPEFQVAKVLNDAPEDDLGGLSGEIAGADAPATESVPAGGAGERVLAAWGRSLFTASEAAARPPWRSWAGLPSAAVPTERAERAIDRIEDPYARANALAAIAESWPRPEGKAPASPTTLALITRLAGKAHDVAAGIADPADRVETLARVAALYPEGDPGRTRTAQESIRLAMQWLRELFAFQKEVEAIPTEPEAPPDAAPLTGAPRRAVRLVAFRRFQGGGGGRREDLNLTPANAQKLVLGAIRSISLLESRASNDAARASASELIQNLARTEQTPNDTPSAGAPSKAMALGYRKISVLDLAPDTLAHLAGLKRRLGIDGGPPEDQLSLFGSLPWSPDPGLAEMAETLLHDASVLMQAGRADVLASFSEGVLARDPSDLGALASAALADDTIRAGGLLLALGDTEKVKQAVARGRDLVARIDASPSLVWQRDWVQHAVIRDDRQKFIDRYTLFRVRVRLGLADLLRQAGDTAGVATLMKDAWADALAVGTAVKGGRPVEGSTHGAERRIAALAEVISFVARMASNEAQAQCLGWLADLKAVNRAFHARLIASEDGARALRRIATSAIRLGRPDDAKEIANLITSDALRRATLLDIADWYAFAGPGEGTARDPAKARAILEGLGDRLESVPRRRDRSLLASRLATLWAHLGDPRRARTLSEKCLPEDVLPAYAAVLDSALGATAEGLARTIPIALTGLPTEGPRPRPALDPEERRSAPEGTLPGETAPVSVVIPAGPTYWPPATPPAPPEPPAETPPAPPPSGPESSPEHPERPHAQLTEEQLKQKLEEDGAAWRHEDAIRQKLATAARLADELDENWADLARAEIQLRRADAFQIGKAERDEIAAQRDALQEKTDALITKMNGALDEARRLTEGTLWPARRERADHELERMYRDDLEAIDKVRRLGYQPRP